MSGNRLNSLTDDLIAANVIAAANHNYNFSPVVQRWSNLFSNPASAFWVKAAGEFALKLFTGEFEENTFGHDTSVS